eukprot:m51a1_g5656 hypothetical protein (635) ;mRNA; r:883435-885557
MDSLAAYGSGSSDDEGKGKGEVVPIDDNFDPSEARSKLSLVPIVPAVEDATKSSKYTSVVSKVITHNPAFEDLYAPVQGPQHPMSSGAAGMAPARAGEATETVMSAYAFDEQYNTFHALGYAVDPSTQSRIVGDLDAAARTGGATVSTQRGVSKAEKEAAKQRKRSRPRGGEPGSGEYLGPWARPAELDFLEEQERQEQQEQEAVRAEGDVPKVDEEEGEEGKAPAEAAAAAAEAEGAATNPRKTADELEAERESDAEHSGDEEEAPEEMEAKRRRATEAGTAVQTAEGLKTTSEGGSSILHIKDPLDYQGRSFLYAPTDLRPVPGHQCYLPKKYIHTWAGHSKGVSVSRLFPETGHLMLSAALDGKCKLWRVYDDMACVRTYLGHSKGIRDACYNYDGKQFLTASYDRSIKQWDTETGQVIRTFSNGRVAYCVKFHPSPDRSYQFLAGCADKRIVQWDCRSGKIVQTYNEHLGAVNTITFVDHNRRFVSTSDDKSIRVWDYGIPVQIKYICEPHMHSMPAVCVTPNGKWMLIQSLDNQILVYGASERFKINRKKRFVGHVVAGYACQVNTSADGRFVISGDGEGKLWIWDWKTTKVLKTLQCHNSVCIGCEWHPIEPSRVVTCGWDGKVNFWD